MAWKGIVNKRFSPDEFEKYVATLHMTTFIPKFIVLHNTATPDLSQRPHGFTNMLGLEQYYRDVKGWSAGPHLFVDDNGIWAFTDLRVSGVHSPSWNSIAWGIEMLGDYDHDPFNSGRGATVRDHAVAAVAILSAKQRFDSSSMHLHKEDPKTTHVCPGKNVIKVDFTKLVHGEIIRRRG